jgi:hypothetical protein
VSLLEEKVRRLHSPKKPKKPKKNSQYRDAVINSHSREAELLTDEHCHKLERRGQRSMTVSIRRRTFLIKALNEGVE